MYVARPMFYFFFLFSDFLPLARGFPTLPRSTANFDRLRQQRLNLDWSMVSDNMIALLGKIHRDSD